MLIAFMAEGSFRDTLTLLQKVLFTTKEGKVSHEEAERVLGAPKHALINEYLLALADRDVQKGVKALALASHENTDIALFARLCIQKMRAALLTREGVVEALSTYSDADQAFIKDLSKKDLVSVSTLKELLDASHAIPKTSVKVLPLEWLLLESR